MEARSRATEPTEPADQFARFFEDTTIDPQTGELLGRYIAEERDTGRRPRSGGQESAHRGRRLFPADLGQSRLVCV